LNHGIYLVLSHFNAGGAHTTATGLKVNIG